MTLGRLVIAWIVVAVWFGIVTFFTGARAVWVSLGEAALLTLIASLWFDSLGSGEWWLLFLLIGALAQVPVWVRSRSDGVPTRLRLAALTTDLGRFVVAGALLAWRLS